MTTAMTRSVFSRETTVGIYNQDTGQIIRQCRLKRGHSFGEPAYITCDKKHGVAYVSDKRRGCIFAFDKNGRHISTLGQKTNLNNDGLICPLGMHLTDAGELCVADKGAHSVTLFPGLGNCGVGDGEPFHLLTEKDGIQDPVAVSFSPRGSVAVAQHSMDFGKDLYSIKVFYPSHKKLSHSTRL